MGSALITELKNSFSTLNQRSVFKSSNGAFPAQLRWATYLLVMATWISAGLFGLYILIFYGGAVPAGRMEDWNKALPKLYETHTFWANVGIGAHFAAGGLLLVLGPIQFISQFRKRFGFIHRILGRIYIFSALFAGLGGTAYILAKGTAGGALMSIGFGLYGFLMAFCAFQSYRHARKGSFALHRSWSIRLFALVIGSWLYRIEYGFWSLAANEAGIGRNFDGPFDMVMDFFFYVPNLIVAEFFIRGSVADGRTWVRVVALTGLVLAITFTVVGTFYFVKFYWGPLVAQRLGI